MYITSGTTKLYTHIKSHWFNSIKRVRNRVYNKNTVLPYRKKYHSF